MNSSSPIGNSQQENENSLGGMPGDFDGYMEASEIEDDFDSKLAKLVKLRENSILSDEEFNKLKQQLIDEVMGK